MMNMKVKVHPGPFAAGHISQHFSVRDNHSLVFISGIIGYVIDDTNRLRQVPLEHIEMISFDGEKKIVSLSEYYKKNPNKAKTGPSKTEDFPDVIPAVNNDTPAEQREKIDKVKPPKSEEERIAAGDTKLKKEKGVKEKVAEVVDGTPD